ncbi:MAG: hypothetical protein K2N27_02770 [Ruminococcus sp.]|nr:hypothetical protein [Ruminococcus sp.]
MKKIITVLTTLCIASGISLTAHAAEMLDKDYIESEIWEEMWLGKNDDGMEYPEASYKHHILDKWIDENYGSDDYDWSRIGELKYEYKDYYNRLIENWDFNDDRNGSWTIDTEDNSYRFQLVNNQWNMIDKNGDTVDIFPIFSTLDEDEEKQNHIPVGDDNGNENNAVGIAGNGTEKPSESLENSDGKVSANSTERAIDGIPERSENSAMPIIIGCIAVVGIGVGGTILYKKRK